MAFVLPYAGGCRITKLFGTPPPTGYHYQAGYHTGLDLVGEGSKKVLACEAGTVVAAAYDADGWGHYIKIRGQKSGLVAIYCHLAQRLVTNGVSVQAGQAIGREGATGQVTGSHLHLEFRRVHNDYKTALDPCPLLGIRSALGEVKRMEWQNADEIIRHWYEIGLLDSPEYWYAVNKVVRNFDQLVEKIAAYYES